MKKNIYICFLREESEVVGILNKIRQQCIAIENLGIKSKLIISRNNKVVLYEIINGKFKEEKSVEYSKRAIYNNEENKYLKKVSSIFRLKEFLKFSKNIVKEELPDSIYIRRLKPITLEMISFIRYVYSKKCKIFWEIPTYSTTHKDKKKLSGIYDEFMHKYISKFLYKNVAIAAEEDLQRKGYIFITNGVNTRNIKLKENKHHNGINLVCMATFDFWHGYDRLIYGLRDYYRENSEQLVYIHMIGNGDVQSLKDLAESCDLKDYVKFHGVLTGEKLNNIFDFMDIAIGNLGFHRVGVYADTSIKIREYCARGIPFVSALNDSDFPNKFKYMKKVEADDSNINIKDICDFYYKISKYDYLMEMREYAETNLSWENKMSPIANMIKSYD